MYKVLFCASYVRNDSRSKRPGSSARRKHNANKKKASNAEPYTRHLRRCLDSLTGWFGQAQLEEPACQCRFLRRQPKKITPLLFVQAAVLLVSQNAVSLSRWAALLGVLGHTSLAKQSLWERINTSAVELLKWVLATVMGQRIPSAGGSGSEALRSFGRVFIQDSTTIQLSPHLAGAFPGASNQRGPQSGLLKIQAVYELVSQRFVHFGLSGFTRNDQAAAHDILSLLQPGELVLRDLGYFVLGSFQKIVERGAFFLSRLRLDTKAYDPGTHKEFGLLKQLKAQGHLDVQVLLGTQQLPVRLVAVKLPPAVAAERRRKARSNRDKRCCPSKRSLQLLGWAIFVTNVERERCRAKTIAQLYGLRWQIESLFKVWKSHFGLTEVPRGSSEQLLVMIYARLLFITVVTRIFQVPWLNQGPDPGPAASWFKRAALLRDYFLFLCLEAWGVSLTGVLSTQLNYHGRYDRRKRTNSVQAFMKLS